MCDSVLAIIPTRIANTTLVSAWAKNVMFYTRNGENDTNRVVLMGIDDRHQDVRRLQCQRRVTEREWKADPVC